MLNFGYWKDLKILDPIAAQNNICSLIGKIAELDSAKRLVDVGSGLSAPAAQWKSIHHSLDISCININFYQLSFALAYAEKISLINATSTTLPFSKGSVDRVIALESAQHFRPLEEFIKESKRILQPGGLLIIAIPIITKAPEDRLKMLLKLGILSLTWSSEHYDLDYIQSIITKIGFIIQEIRYIGHYVYEPLTDYYILNRNAIRAKILKKYSPFLESILYKSLLKMKDVSKSKMIDYAIIKAHTSN
jgi:ubiquinone/menaquinone biosynthesis C-methylase UbiE